MTNVLEYMEQTVPSVPDKIAFASDTSALTFREVYTKSRAIGSCLHEKGYYKEPVAIYMRKSPETVVSFFGTVYGGCYYVPLDEEMPRFRVELILKTLEARVMIADETTYEEAVRLKEDGVFTGEILLYREITLHPEDGAALTEIRVRALDTDPIYIVFTSGSTGVPKGVVACHRSVLDYVERLSATLGFNRETVFGNQAPLYFDACLKELYPTLKFGATTYLIPKSLFMFPVKLVEYLNEHKINTVCWVVSAFTLISSFGTFKTVKPEYLHTIAFGSEVFPIKQFNLWREALPNASFTNLYGPTETTGMCCFFHVDREFAPDEPIPIGRPFQNREILLLKADNTLAADGEEGEICVRGTALTLGYYKNPEKTAEAFVQNPLNKLYPELIYRTGDIGKRNERGELIFVSRKDFQIKHMGHRIELGEIETAAGMMDGIRAACAVYDTEKKRIVLYYTGEVEQATLSAYLKERLPRYMMPGRMTQLENLPYTPNGKIDRNKLKDMVK